MAQENRRLREGVAELCRVNEILRAASAYFASELDPATVMTFIFEHRDRFAVALLLRVLNIAASTYYQWVKQAEQPCYRDLVDLGLISNIHEIWEAPAARMAPTGYTGSCAEACSFRSRSRPGPSRWSSRLSAPIPMARWIFAIGTSAPCCRGASHQAAACR